MNDPLTPFSANVGGLLLILNLGGLLLVGWLVVHTAALRSERRAQTGQLAEQLGRALTGLQKINSSIIAQTNELKERLGVMKPALEQAGQLLREGTTFTDDFKAVRGELRQLDERIEALNRTAAEVAASQAATGGALGELGQQVGALRQEVAATTKAQPGPELRQIQEQVGALQQAVAASVQAQAVSAGELRSDLGALAAEQSLAARAARDSLAAELHQQEARFRQLAEKFLAESAQLRSRIEDESRSLSKPPGRQTTLDSGPSAKPELDAETRKEFRKITDRLDGLQRRLEEVIQL